MSSDFPRSAESSLHSIATDFDWLINSQWNGEREVASPLQRLLAALETIAENTKPVELEHAIYVQGDAHVHRTVAEHLADKPNLAKVMQEMGVETELTYQDNGRGLESVVFRLHCRCGSHVFKPDPRCEWCHARVQYAKEFRRAKGGVEEGFDLRG